MKKNLSAMLGIACICAMLSGCGAHYVSESSVMMPSTGTTAATKTCPECENATVGSTVGDVVVDDVVVDGVAAPGFVGVPMPVYTGPRLDQKAMNPDAWMLEHRGYTPFSPVYNVYSGPVAGTPGAPMMDPFYGPLAGPFSQIPAAQPAAGLSDGPYVFRGPRDYLGDMSKMPPLGP